MQVEAPDRLKEFAKHSVQLAEPTTCLYVPATHALQVLPSGPAYPVLHLQSVKTVLPAGAVKSAPQLVQSEAPVALKESAKHGLHMLEPSGELVPAAQRPVHVATPRPLV